MSTHDDDVERLIDSTAHALTRGEPSTRVRAAVRAQLEPRARGWDRRVWVPAVAALLLIVLAGPLLRNGPERTPPRIADVLPLPSAQSLPPREPERPVSESPLAATATPPRAPRVAPPAAIAPIEPLVIEPLSVPLMAVTEVPGAMPIDIAPLQVELMQPQ